MLASLLLLALAADAPLTLGKGPYIADLDLDRVELRWEQPFGAGTVVVDTGGHWAATPFVERDGNLARARLEGLSPDRLYRYRVQLDGKHTAEQTFKTFPLPGEPVSFVVFGDTRTNHDIHARIAKRIAAENPDFVLHTGDLVSNGARLEDWSMFFEAERPLLAEAPIFSAVGNHEVRGVLNSSWWDRWYPHNRYYAKRAGVVLALFVDSTQSYSPGSRQHTWLKQKLSDARRDIESGIPLWIIVMHHHPAWSSGHHGSTTAIQRELTPLYEAYGVHAVMQGHDHLFERLEHAGVTYYVTGGGGAPLYESTGIPQTQARAKAHHYVKVSADADSMRITAVDLDGNILDKKTFDRNTHPIKGSAFPIPPPSTMLGTAGSGLVVLMAGISAWLASGKLVS